MFRRVIAGLILGPALLLGSFAWSGFLALRTVFDEDRSRDVAEELLDNDEVRAQLAKNLGTAVEAALPEQVPISGDQVERTATAVLDDPRVTALVLDALGGSHRAFLGEGEAPETLDLAAVSEVVRERLAVFAPEAAAALPESPEFTVDLPTERIPNARPVKSFLERVVPYLAGASLAMVLLAFLTTSDRPSVLRRAARWALGTTLVYLALGYGVPALLQLMFPGKATVFTALVKALLRTTLIPSVVLAAVGVVLLLASWAWPDGDGDDRDRDDRGPSVPTAPPVAPVSSPPVQSSLPPVPAPRPPPAVSPGPAPTTAVPTTPAASARPAPSPPPAASPAPSPPPAHQAPDPVATPPVAPVDPNAPAPFRPTLPTRAAHDTGPVVSADPSQVVPDPAPAPAIEPTPPVVSINDPAPIDVGPQWAPPTWNPEHGWVLDPADERPRPENAEWVEGVGYVVPGPPPAEG